jgi:outer membrane protein assembly factor BamD
MISCSEYSELLKSTDYDVKFEAAKEYYEEKEYFKAETLLKELLTVYKGTKKAEQIYYYYAYCQFGLNDYDFAAFHFKNFVKNFSKSERTEEMHYMIPVCYSKLSPDPSLDQSHTQKAIEEFQLFLDKYPNSERKEEANKEIDLLRDKLEVKAFELAYLYYKVEDYKAAIIALKNVVKEYPDVGKAEEIRFYIVESSYLLAKMSVESKKVERYRNTLEEINTFEYKHKDSDYQKQVDNYRKLSKKALSLQD